MANDKNVQLSPGEYWEWRTTISEMDTAREVLRAKELELKLLHKEAEIASLRAKVFQGLSLIAAKSSYEKAIEEYKRFKGVLEERLGVSLDNKIISDTTFEVTDVPTQQNLEEK